MLNLTQHKATAEQLRDGVVDLPPEQAEELRHLITFAGPPSSAELRRRAQAVAALAEGHTEVMIGGAPYFMHHLEEALLRAGKRIWYAFSARDVIEDNGIKTSVFRHIGFVDARFGEHVSPESLARALLMACRGSEMAATDAVRRMASVAKRTSVGGAVGTFCNDMQGYDGIGR